MVGRHPDNSFDVAHVMKLLEQRFELLCRRYPEQCPGGFVRFVEIAMRNAARQPHQIAGKGADPLAIEFEIEHALLYQDELFLGGMDMHRHKLAGIAIGLESEGGLGDGLREVDLSEDVPGGAAIARPFWVIPFRGAAMSAFPLVNAFGNAAWLAGMSLAVERIHDPADEIITATGPARCACTLLL